MANPNPAGASDRGAGRTGPQGESPRRDTPGAGRTESSKESSPGPRLPNERDESADSQASQSPDAADISRRAYEDAAQGLPDTGRLPVTDEVYNDQVADRERSPPPLKKG